MKNENKSAAVMFNILSDDNIEQFKTELNVKMKLFFGVDDWIGYAKFNLADYYGMNISDVEKIILRVDRDYE
jgi:hypothetical protein